jgi:hypothetical protein
MHVELAEKTREAIGHMRATEDAEASGELCSTHVELVEEEEEEANGNMRATEDAEAIGELCSMHVEHVEEEEAIGHMRATEDAEANGELCSEHVKHAEEEEVIGHMRATEDAEASGELCSEHVKHAEEEEVIGHMRATEDAEKVIGELCSMHVKLAEKTREAIRHMRATADMMDQVWRRCKGTKVGATAVSIVGGGLTIGGGIATLLTAGVAFPLFISGLVISVVGGASNFITAVVQNILDSNERKALDRALQDCKEKEILFEAKLQSEWFSYEQINDLLKIVKEGDRSEHILLKFF